MSLRDRMKFNLHICCPECGHRMRQASVFTDNGADGEFRLSGPFLPKQGETTIMEGRYKIWPQVLQCDSERCCDKQFVVSTEVVVETTVSKVVAVEPKGE